LTQLIGWFAAIALMLTLGAQAAKQYRSTSTGGVSRWLYIGQLVASSAFVAYSIATGDVVFVVTNLILVGFAGFGLFCFLRNRRRESDNP
jgi:uncharacterized protein with PQ loop repeat